MSHWSETLTRNACGRRVLTLRAALSLARQREAGWYVAPYAAEYWTIGKLGADGDAYHVLVSDEPLTFCTRNSAEHFLKQLLPPGTPFVARSLDRHGSALEQRQPGTYSPR